MTHHLIIASEQLWPNLLGLAALQQRDGGVSSLHILHTGDERRSADPARQLNLLAGKMQPGLKVVLHETGLTSQEVIGVVHTLLSATAAEESWSINATGGTKTMFAGLIPWVRRPNVEAFYLEVTGTWFQLAPMEVDGLQLLSCEAWDEAMVARLSLPVEALATIQANHPEGVTWRHQKPAAMDVPTVIRDGIRHGWNWPELHKLHPPLGTGRSGFAFEAFFGALLQACGADNVVLNLEMLHEGKVRQEFDAIVSTGKKIIVFDLKLSEPDAVINQISRLGQDRKNLGGLNAMAIAVRPNWHQDPVTEAIAKSHHVEIWTQQDMPKILAKICTSLGRTDFSTDKVLMQMQSALEQSASEGCRIFTQSRFLPFTGSSIEQQVGWLNLQPYLDECRQAGRNAMVLQLGNKFLAWASTELPGWNSPTELGKDLPSGGHVDWFWQSKTAATSLALLSCPTEQAEALKQYLQALLRAQVRKVDRGTPPPDAAKPSTSFSTLAPRSNLADAFK